ncbi:unnamed protein product, partial [Dicrocoelium dendriticum]
MQGSFRRCEYRTNAVVNLHRCGQINLWLPRFNASLVLCLVPRARHVSTARVRSYWEAPG